MTKNNETCGWQCQNPASDMFMSVESLQVNWQAETATTDTWQASSKKKCQDANTKKSLTIPKKESWDFWIKKGNLMRQNLGSYLIWAVGLVQIHHI